MTLSIGIVFGGKSGEHEVSVQSAEFIRASLDRTKYRPLPIGIDRRGRWGLFDPERPLGESVGRSVESLEPAERVLAAPGEGGRAELRRADSGILLETVDCFFPIAHGSYGEDGCLQGLLRMLETPFVGAGVTGSALGMDKDVMKRLLREAGLPVCRFVTVRAEERDDLSYDVLAHQLGSPFFVKPCRLGSSVGIHRVDDPEAFEAALADALAYDHKLVIEEAVEGREIELAVLGNQAPRVSLPGEIRPRHAFYSYAAKYEDEAGAELCIPAELEPECVRELQELARICFETLECRGLARVDFFLKPDGKALINEINTLPGFTRISMYPKLWQASGLEPAALMDRLIELALEAQAGRDALRRHYGD